jgi:hypothetical protein
MQLIYVFPPDELPQPATLRMEESEWRNPVAPGWFTLRWPHPFAFEQNESPTLQTALDFSEWENPVAPAFVNTVPQIFTADDVFVAPQPMLAVEEDWNVKPAPVFAFPVPRIFGDDETLVPTPPIQDEDYWTSGVAPVWCYPATVFLADDVIQFASPIQDDYAWQSNIAPAVASNWLQLPYLPDPEEIPAGTLIVESTPTVLGSGAVAAVSGAGVVTMAVGAGQAGVASGEGGINQV